MSVLCSFFESLLAFKMFSTNYFKIFSPFIYVKGKGKVFYGQEPPRGESTSTECGINYQLLAVIYCSSPVVNSWLQSPQPATDNGIRDGRSN